MDELKELDEKRGDRMVSHIIKEGGGATALVAATVMPCCPLFAQLSRDLGSSQNLTILSLSFFILDCFLADLWSRMTSG